MKLTADLSLIHPYTPDDDRNSGPPTLTHYHKDGKDLFYIGAHHGVGTDRPTSQAVREVIERVRPQLVIIEGLETDKGLSPQYFADYSRGQAASNFAHDGEAVYASYLANANHIPFIGGEAPEADIFKAMQSKGYSPKETMAYYLLRWIPEERRHGTLNVDNFVEQAQQYLNSSVFSHIPAQERLTFPEFQAWYEKHNTSGRGFLDATVIDTAPYAFANATYFQKMGDVIGSVREAHLDRLIADSLKSNNRVLVVYGSAHWMQSRPVFEDMFAGKGETFPLLANGAAYNPVTGDPMAYNPLGNPEALHTPRLPKALLYTSIALSVAAFASAGIVGLLSLPTLLLIGGGALAYSGSRLTSNDKGPASPAATPAASDDDNALRYFGRTRTPSMPAHDMQGRRDHKSWVAATAERDTTNSRTL